MLVAEQRLTKRLCGRSVWRRATSALRRSRPQEAPARPRSERAKKVDYRAGGFITLILGRAPCAPFLLNWHYHGTVRPETSIRLSSAMEISVAQTQRLAAINEVYPSDQPDHPQVRRGE